MCASVRPQGHSNKELQGIAPDSGPHLIINVRSGALPVTLLLLIPINFYFCSFGSCSTLAQGDPLIDEGCVSTAFYTIFFFFSSPLGKRAHNVQHRASLHSLAELKVGCMHKTARSQGCRGETCPPLHTQRQAEHVCMHAALMPPFPPSPPCCRCAYSTQGHNSQLRT